MNSNENTTEETVTSQNFDFLKKISKIRMIYLRAFQKSMNSQLDKDLTLVFKNTDPETFKDIKQSIIKNLARFMDEKFCALIESPDMQEKLLEYYKLDVSYQNKPVKFALLAAEEEIPIKEEAIELVKSKRESFKDIANKTNQLKDEKYEQLSKIFDEITIDICKYDSLTTKSFAKDNLFD